MAGRKFSDEDLLGGDDDDGGTEFPAGEEDGADGLDEIDFSAPDDDEPEEELASKKEEEDGEDEPNGDPSEEDGGEESADGLSSWERDNYSIAMQQRVSRERKLRKQAEERTDTLEVEKQQLHQRAYNAEKAGLELLTANINREIQDKTAELKRAKEDGDLDAELTLAEELDNLRAKKRQVEQTKESLPAPSSQAGPVNTLAKRWMERNRWFSNENFKAEIGYAKAIDSELANEGKLQPNTPAYFTELDKRIHESIPALRVKIKRTFGSAPGVQVARVTSKRPGRPSALPKRLEKEDIRNAVNFGIDPKNPKQMEEYMLQKRKRIAAQQSGGR